MKRAIVIGGGHNALTAAYYLATASKWGAKGFLGRSHANDMKVTVLERRSVVGGAAVTEEFEPGFRNSTASYSVGLLSPEVVREMDLRSHGLKMHPRKGAHFVPISSTEYFMTSYDDEENLRRIARLSPKDADAYVRYNEMLQPIVPFLQQQFLVSPPSFSSSNLRTASQVAQLCQDALRSLSPTAARSLYELFTRSAGDILDSFFETDVLKGILAFDAITGNYASVYSAGSAYVMLHHVMGEIFDHAGQWGHATGGMGSITQAMAKACVTTGNVEIATDAHVKCVLTEDGGMQGM